MLVDYGQYYIDQITDEMEEMVDDLEAQGIVENPVSATEQRLYQVTPEHHGFIFEGMWNNGDEVELKDFILASVVFDQNDHVAGLKYMQPSTKEILIDTPLRAAQLYEDRGDRRLLEDITGHTRLVGLRTTKECEGSKNIMSVQPIYYSIDKKMCTEVLQSLDQGLLNEISSYGPTCAEVEAEEAF
mmetsp:Transcript_31059/g.41169  ORF Transcript_31059/g.41169 Transcript_31059/m.41169 type:complete len:186 (+) Transcript_31059:372-929(+)